MSLFLNILGGISAISGLMGAAKSGRHAGRQEEALMAEFLDALREQRKRATDMYGEAKRYAPEIEDARVAAEATRETQNAVRDALRSAVARFRSAGGDTSDSEFGVRATGIASRAQEQLASMIASMRANTFAKKQDAIARALGMQPNPQGFLQASSYWGKRREQANSDLLGHIASFITFAKGIK